MRRGRKCWEVLSKISFAMSLVTLCLGFDKMLVYDSGDSYPFEYHNAYVGGDAYNYIINGNYATAFFVLTAALVIAGAIFAGVYYLSKIEIALLEDSVTQIGLPDSENKEVGQCDLAERVKEQGL